MIKNYTILILSGLFMGLPLLQSQNEKTFSKNDSFKKVVDGDVVRINADTAFVISKATADFLNDKQLKLQEVQLLYNDLVDNKNELLDELKTIQKLVTQLSKKIQADSTLISENMVAIIGNLDTTLTDLKENNEDLKKNNIELENKIRHLNKIVKDLKKETSHIWWNGLMDKIVAFAGGIAVGILIASSF